MKILHVITAIIRGGAENHLRDLIEGQVRSYNSQVSCAYLTGGDYWRSDLEALGVRVIALGLSRYGDIRPVYRLRRAIRELMPDLVHAHLAPAELYTRMALLGDRKTPLVISCHNEDAFYPGPGSRMLERWVIRRAQRLIAISESVGQVHAARWPRRTASRLEVVYYGIDPRPFADVPAHLVADTRHEWGATSSDLLVGAVARMVPQKSLHTLIEGFALHLRNRTHTAGLKLLLLGRGPLERELRERAHNLGVSRYVIWAGFRNDMPVVMSALDIVALPSISEGFGLVLLEAMCASKPVIASRISAIPEIVTDGETGLLFPPRSPEAIKEALDALAGDPQLRLRLGQNGRRRAWEVFTLRRMVEGTMKVYSNLLEEERSARTRQKRA